MGRGICSSTRCPAHGSARSTSRCWTPATRWPPTCRQKLQTTLLLLEALALSSWESNFGPMEELLQQTQLTEHEFFPLVMQLLHGQEMEYMTYYGALNSF